MFATFTYFYTNRSTEWDSIENDKTNLEQAVKQLIWLTSMDPKGQAKALLRSHTLNTKMGIQQEN